MSFLSQSHHSPIAAAAPAELNLQEMSCDMVSRLLEQVLDITDNKCAIMLLDMRPSVLYATSSIKTAVSVSIPNMLLKRPMFSLQKVTGQLTTEQDVETFSRWKEFSNIVLFDAAGAAPVVGSPTYFMVQKFRKEGCNATLGFLNGGFNEFSLQHGDLCRTEGMPLSGESPQQKMSLSSNNLALSAPTPVATNPMSLVSPPPRQRLHLGSLPSLMTQPPAGPLGCQTPMIENPNVNPLFESVRQAMGLSTNITEEIPVRMPMGFSVDIMQSYLPRWLLQAVTEESGKSRLSEFFQNVEINENRRLALLMLPQNMRSGRTTTFSIGAGIEKGLKNRYNNVWPYDHTRVKLAEVEQGHDDYLNASFLTPMLSKKRYIATQGPLPSTFQDFWKATWEQNSRVVVMLTREQEMGRLKCHEYWPTARQPVMDVGVMQVTFVTEFLPDLTNGTILVRQLKLKHLAGPESEERNITQVQYTGWPDYGVPETPLEVLRVIQLANEYNTPVSSAGPMVVHCSAGCGRTGAFCVIDSILTELQERPDAMMSDIVYTSVSTFREQRISMVQTLRQYVFCYEAIFWHLAMEFVRERPALGLMVIPPPSMAVHTPLLPMPPLINNDSVAMMTSNPALSMGNAPITTTSEEFSFFG
ncbi:protein-tyrosine phosphatase-like protein [Dissophora ornata]|nr:protein-tyrosine phosphatase-like protein [Dissophora ornata]